MKKLLSLLIAFALVGFYACSDGGGEAQDEGTEDATEEPAMEEESTDDDSAAAEEEMSDGDEELAEHICGDMCDGEDHHYAHGEKGHECDENCAGMMEGEDHEGHDHDTEEG